MRRGGSLVVLGGVGVLSLVGILIALLASRQPEARFAANSPQGTVATYLHLLQDGQVDKAYTMTSWENADHYVSLGEFHQQFDSWSQASHRVTAVSTTVNGQAASVVIDITAFSGGAFGASDQTRRLTITLIRNGARWSITGPPWLGYP